MQDDLAKTLGRSPLNGGGREGFDPPSPREQPYRASRRTITERTQHDRSQNADGERADGGGHTGTDLPEIRLTQAPQPEPRDEDRDHRHPAEQSTQEHRDRQLCDVGRDLGERVLAQDPQRGRRRLGSPARHHLRRSENLRRLGVGRVDPDRVLGAEQRLAGPSRVTHRDRAHRDQRLQAFFGRHRGRQPRVGLLSRLGQRTALAQQTREDESVRRPRRFQVHGLDGPGDRFTEIAHRDDPCECRGGIRLQFGMSERQPRVALRCRRVSELHPHVRHNEESLPVVGMLRQHELEDESRLVRLAENEEALRLRERIGCHVRCGAASGTRGADRTFRRRRRSRAPA